jgi:dihydrofolate reductase
VGEGAPASIALLVAVAENGVIGRDGDLPWRLSSDLKLFRRLSMGKPLVMGRKTFATLKGPLDGRDNIVVTRDAGFTADGAIVAHSVDEALRLARDFARRRGAGEIIVIGGAEIYRQTLPVADRIYLTRVNAAPRGDVTFPPLDMSQWRVIQEESYKNGPKDDFSFTFSVLERISAASATV